MKRKSDGSLIHSPTDLCRFLESTYASWMDRWYLDKPEGRDLFGAEKAKGDRAISAQAALCEWREILYQGERKKEPFGSYPMPSSLASPH